MDNLKTITNELAENSSVYNTYYLAKLVNTYCKDAAKVTVSDKGDTNIQINLTADLVKYLMIEFYKQVNNE